MARPKRRPKAQPPLRPPLTPSPQTRFRKDIELAAKRGKDLAKLWAVVDALCDHRPLDPKLRDHPLSGEWEGFRDCHIEGDWVLVYCREGGRLLLIRTGTHSDLFG